MKCLKYLSALTMLLLITACGQETAAPSEPAPGTNNPLPVPDNGQVETPAESTAWQLDGASSALHFVTTKKLHVSEVAHFSGFAGSISSRGLAELVIDLNSVDSANSVRDQRLRDLLFETAVYPQARVEAQVDAQLVDGLAVGAERTMTLAFTLDLHGITQNIQASVMVSRLTADRLMVRSLAPLVVDGLSFGFEAGFAELKSLAKLTSLGTSVPVSFYLVFRRAEVQS
ncbi:YceI family protein [Simiduia agarivorans]|uniref:YceI family protein n=1 Tax=Simiduia agarivorans TaxID=447471 RepID=UPI0002DBC182|nr:YceI family protein [Simiduia agarivorans]